jgi:hypothetical protein
VCVHAKSLRVRVCLPGCVCVCFFSCACTGDFGRRDAALLQETRLRTGWSLHVKEAVDSSKEALDTSRLEGGRLEDAVDTSRRFRYLQGTLKIPHSCRNLKVPLVYRRFTYLKGALVYRYALLDHNWFCLLEIRNLPSAYVISIDADTFSLNLRTRTSSSAAHEFGCSLLFSRQGVVAPAAGNLEF